jgi:3-phenylpropionate/cinnamic acid dioxygenase small subunit
MSDTLDAPAPSRQLDRLLLKADVEEFLYHEADLLDRRCFKEWLELLSDDISYFMPIRRNVKFGQQAERENTRRGEGISWFDEDKWTLTKRVEQILTGVHYAEEPLSRITHMVSNVMIVNIDGDAAAPREVGVRSNILVYQNRVERETYVIVGRRNDILRRDNGGWRIASREILIEQNVLLAKNLSTFY